MDITVSEKYLWFPVDMSGEMVWVSVYDGDQKIQEMKVSLGKEHIDFYGYGRRRSILEKSFGLSVKRARSIWMALISARRRRVRRMIIRTARGCITHRHTAG